MQFTFAKEEQAFREELRSFLKEELPRKWRYGLIETAEEDSELASSMRRKLSDRGWLTMGWPKGIRRPGRFAHHPAGLQ